MKQRTRSALILAGAASLAAARAPALPNPWTVVVSNGPFAGTYKANANEVMCFHYKEQKMLGASFRDFDAKDAHALGDGGIKIDNPDAPGPKTADLHVSFGDGKGADITGAGKTKEGVMIRITANCAEIEML